MAERASSLADAAVADAAVADAAVADATVADAAVADAILQIETVAPSALSARKRSCQACCAALCALLAPCRAMLLFFRKLPTPSA